MYNGFISLKISGGMSAKLSGYFANGLHTELLILSLGFDSPMCPLTQSDILFIITKPLHM